MSVCFGLNDNVVYPSHGVATITRKVDRSISGSVTTLYELKFLHKEMTILVPINNFESIGIRPLSSEDKITELFGFFNQDMSSFYFAESSANNWKHRNKEYQTKLRRGGLQDIACIYRELRYIEYNKELSFCEKNLLAQTELLLAEEVALVKNISEESAVDILRSFFPGQSASLHSPKPVPKVVHQVL